MSSPVFYASSLKKIITNIILVLIPGIIGFLSSRLAGNTAIVYNSFKKPPLSPPPIVFPIVWGILYLLMGISLVLAYRKSKSKEEFLDSAIYFFAQLFLNFLWPIVFFKYQAFFYAVLILIAMWIFTGITVLKFYRINHLSGILLIPYWLWLTFALYLNIGVWLLNR